MLDAIFQAVIALIARIFCIFNDELKEKRQSLDAMERAEIKHHKEAMQKIRERSREIKKQFK